MIKLLIADNQLLTREGITIILADINNISIIGKATTMAELDLMTATFKPDVIVIDHKYDPHFNTVTIKNIYAQFDFVRILILSNRQPKNEIMEVINLGVKNYVNKDCTDKEFINAVYAAANGEQFYCKHTLQTLFGHDMKLEKAEGMPLLSYRETEIVQLIAEGMGNKEIAEKLFLSIHTIKTHRKNIIKKLGFTFKHASELVVLLSYLNDTFI